MTTQLSDSLLKRITLARIDELRMDVQLVVTPVEYREIEAAFGDGTDYVWGVPVVVEEQR